MSLSNQDGNPPSKPRGTSYFQAHFHDVADLLPEPKLLKDEGMVRFVGLKRLPLKDVFYIFSSTLKKDLQTLRQIKEGLTQEMSPGILKHRRPLI